jgi:hypothetical protein
MAQLLKDQGFFSQKNLQIAISSSKSPNEKIYISLTIRKTCAKN